MSSQRICECCTPDLFPITWCLTYTYVEWVYCLAMYILRLESVICEWISYSSYYAQAGTFSAHFWYVASIFDSTFPLHRTLSVLVLTCSWNLFNLWNVIAIVCMSADVLRTSVASEVYLVRGGVEKFEKCFTAPWKFCRGADFRIYGPKVILHFGT